MRHAQQLPAGAATGAFVAPRQLCFVAGDLRAACVVSQPAVIWHECVLPQLLAAEEWLGHG